MAKWISVKDRLPEHGSLCYIFCDDGECDSWVHYFTDDKRGKIWTSTDTGAPKAEFVDRYVESTGNLGFRQVATDRINVAIKASAQ
jgi:hypothetical protein